jgi:SAM-dependent methyltransferase
MHATALADMTELLNAAPPWTKTVLDVGSYDENGTNRPLVEGRGWHYTGLDIRDGPNVDIIAGPYLYPFEDNSFDLVISGQAMEHVEDLRSWINECVRVLAPGGRLCITTVWKMFYHPFPVDCWRIMPDGMRWLFNQNGLLVDYDIQMTSEDATGGNIVGAATKKGK